MNTENPKLILCAGMPRSASTWFYNVIRLVLLHDQNISQKLCCGWVGDVSFPSPTHPSLIKIHNYTPSLVGEADFIFYSFRDVRDSLASCERKFDQLPTLNRCDEFIEQYYLWTEVATYVMKYEDMITNAVPVIENISTILGVDINPLEIEQNIKALSFPTSNYNKTNLYHHNHCTTNGDPGSWRQALDPKLVTQIETKYQNWFTNHHYKTGIQHAPI